MITNQSVELRGLSPFAKDLNQNNSMTIERDKMHASGPMIFSQNHPPEHMVEDIISKVHPVPKNFKRKTIKNFSSNPIDFFVYPLNHFCKINPKIPSNYSQMRCSELQIAVNREDGKTHNLQAFTFPAARQNEFDPAKPVVVIFHPNASTGKNMGRYIKTYLNNGYQTMSVTMGGYPDSDEGIHTSEITSYQDANAVIEYLKSLGAKEIIIHGTSIGGTLAFAAAELHPDVVKVIIADQTLDKIDHVAENLIRNNVGVLTPASLTRFLVKNKFPKNRTVPGVYKNGLSYKTDGLNNAEKAAVINAEVIVIKSNNDIMMGVKDSITGKLSGNLADEIINRRYHLKNADASNKVFEIKGNHCSWFPDPIIEMQFIATLRKTLHPES